MSTEIIRQAYQGVEIEYRENTDNWVFELGGRERTAPSLKQAKSVIDSAPKPKKQVVRFQAYLIGWAETKIEEVTVGAASKDYRGRPQFWVSGSEGRSKQDANALVKKNETNERVLAEVRSLSDQIVSLQKERSAKIALLERVDIPDDAEQESK